MSADDELVCHELLVRLAGRLPDELLWRFRDWLGAGALRVLAKTLPKTLLKYGINLTRDEYDLVVSGLVPYGTPSFHAISLQWVDDAPANRYTFSSEVPEGMNIVDTAPALLDAALRGRPDVGEVRESWRSGGPAGEQVVKRVLLVNAFTGLPRLAGELQRMLRVLGDTKPSVEVLQPRWVPGSYHQDALANSNLISVGAAGVGDQYVA